MTLKEAIEAQGDGFLYIGSKTGYEWIGKKEDAISGVKDASEKKHRQLIRVTIPDYIRKIKASNESVREKHYEIMTANTDDEDALNVKWEEAQELAERLETVVGYLSHTIDYMKNWTDYLDRQVVDIYQRTGCEPFGTIIIFEGEEQGSYWAYDEVQKGD